MLIFYKPYSNTYDLPNLLDGCGTVVLNDGLVEGSSGVERSQHSLTGCEDLHCCEAICEWLFGYKLNTFRPYIVAVVALRMVFFFFSFLLLPKSGKKKHVLFCILRFGMKD